ncbi:MAG: glycoside hydrolase family 16 protein [Flavobacterium sp.]|uniref:glycoside hydrolase family 16 protein n=1 Tax=Flavobacterium sp. TaxID=239 RepID=UPI0012275E52|nr:glycoside hydrolase family 16 protein [Flavobacterium sp.]RZJ65238.1 MAG: glycoside hydrolase family 16 protein [Flavobacterium sp.]
MKNFFKTAAIFFSLAFISVSCSSSGSGSGNDDDGPAAVAPTNLVISSEIVGQDDQNPNGDGSGMVAFTVSADNAQSIQLTFQGGAIQTVNGANGTIDKQFTTIGTNTYVVSVKAFGTGNTSITSSTAVTVFYAPQLVWSEEFDIDGAPNATNWTLETGAGGWGNNEAQYYTTSLDNAKVEGGLLKITAKKQDFSGAAYTSARMKSENKFEFTYGKIEARAKLATGAGTWPAIWALGENYASATWPSCGEIDMMEHVGNQQNTIHATLHYPGHSGGNANTNHMTVPTASTEFHIYSCEWSAQSLKFYVDGNLFHTVFNSTDLPFNHDFFLILNMAMGGNFGGNIDPNFVESTMEIDYLRVYQ